jgi:hypothetical protein
MRKSRDRRQQFISIVVDLPTLRAIREFHTAPDHALNTIQVILHRSDFRPHGEPRLR